MQKILVMMGFAGGCALWAGTAVGQPAPPLVDTVTFEDLTPGQGIAKDRYLSRGIRLSCSPGHWLVAVEPRAIAVTPPGADLWIAIEFVVPGSGYPGTLQRSEVGVLDPRRAGYGFFYYDIHGGGLSYGSNLGDYLVGGGWYFSDGTTAHRVKLTVGTGELVHIDSVAFSMIANGGPLSVRTWDWGAIRQLYR